MYKIIKPFRYCEDGFTVQHVAPGDYEELPEIALQHARNIKALDPKSDKDSKKQ